MNTAIRRPVRLSLKSNFADWAVLRDERRHDILSALAMRDQVEHGILRLPELVRRILRIGHQEAARTANRRLLVTDRALVTVESSAQSRRVGQRRQVWILPRV